MKTKAPTTQDCQPGMSTLWLQCLGLSKKSAEAVMRAHREATSDLVDALKNAVSAGEYVVNLAHANDKAGAENARIEREVVSVLRHMTKTIVVRQGGAHEDIYATLAVSVSSLEKELSEARAEVERLKATDSEEWLDSYNRIIQERETALAACAEMRAFLEKLAPDDHSFNSGLLPQGARQLLKASDCGKSILAELAELREEKAAGIRLVSKLQGRLEQKESEADGSKDMMADMSATIATLERELERVSTNYDRATDELDALEREKAGLQKELVAANRGAERNANVNRLVTQKNISLREGLRSIANMPEYDQDDAHRLRNMAQGFLAQPSPKGEGKHCEDCDPSFMTCWNDITQCRKQIANPRQPQPPASPGYAH